MGKKNTVRSGAGNGTTEPNDIIWAKDNPYGYKINVNHPKILPLYQRYKDKIGERILSDQQRRHFELLIFELIERRNKQ